jgi:hypothetical protein
MPNSITPVQDMNEDINEVLRVKTELHASVETLVDVLQRQYSNKFNNETMLPVLLGGVLGSTIGLLLRNAPSAELIPLMQFIEERILESINLKTNDAPQEKEFNLETMKTMGRA